MFAGNGRRALWRKPGGKVSRAAIVDHHGLVVGDGAAGLWARAPLSGPRCAAAHLLSNPRGKTLRVRVLMTADKLIKVLVCKHFGVECIGHPQEGRQAPDFLQKTCGSIGFLRARGKETSRLVTISGDGVTWGGVFAGALIACGAGQADRLFTGRQARSW